MKLTEPPFATVSTRISLNASRISGEAFNALISISGISASSRRMKTDFRTDTQIRSSGREGRERLLDLGNSFDVLDLKMAASLKDLQRVLFVRVRPETSGRIAEF